MASSGKSMRLSIEVLPLASENAHGPTRHLALAAFKGRKFALPVPAEATFEQVWAKIEDRYKTNYLSPIQAEAFTIKKLQDAYDCDLDIGDTVRSIFEDETDHTMRVIKVVPSFVDRAFSVPASSNLRPKRLREIETEHASKRQRVENSPSIAQETVLRDEPMPTTESELSAENDLPGDIHGARASSRSWRSHTGGSLVVVQDVQTGRAEFAPSVKEESPELGDPPVARAPGPAQGHHMLQRQVSTSRIPLTQEERATREEHILQPADEVPETDDGHQNGTSVYQNPILSGDVHQMSPEAGLRQSRLSEFMDSGYVLPRATKRRKDVYDVSSSPEFMKPSTKPKNTFGRAAVQAAAKGQKAVHPVDLLNSSRSQLANGHSDSSNSISKTPLSKAARAFRFQETDEIESTPHEDIAAVSRQAASPRDDLTTSFLDNTRTTPQAGFQATSRDGDLPKSRPGSLKKPSKNRPLATSSIPNTPHRDNEDVPISASGVNHGASEISNNRRDPSIQARLDRVNNLRPKNKDAAVDAPQVTSEVTNFNADETTRHDSEVDGITEHMDLDPETADVVPTSSTNRKLTLPSQARATPKRSPVPLPTNTYMSATSAQITQIHPELPKDDHVFKKPTARRTPKPKDAITPGNKDKSRTGSEVSDKGSSFRNTAMPSTENTQNPANDVTPESNTHTPAASQPKKRGRPRLSSPRSSAKPKSSTKPQTSTQPKKRGRPRKVPLAETMSVATPVSTPAPESRKGGRTLSKSSSTNTSLAAPRISSLPTDKLGSPSNGTVIGKQTHKPTPENTIAISSGSSSDDAQSVIDMEPSSQISAAGVAKNNSSQTKNAAVILEEQQVPSAPQVKDLTDPADEREDTKVLESSIQAFLGEAQEGIDEQDTSSRAHPLRQANTWGFASLNKSADGNNHSHGGVEDVQHEKSTTKEDSLDAPVSTFAAVEAGSKSRSVSAALSNRSSPAISRAPARYLSHSPTPEGSGNESEDTSAASSKAATPQPVADKDRDSDSSSDTDSSTSDDSDEEIPSSPPVSKAPAQTPVIPSTSQAAPSTLVRQTPVPLPTNISSQVPGSSQSVSGQAATRRRTAGHSGLKSLREQLAEVRTKSATIQKKTFDPRMMNLGKAAAKGIGKTNTVIAMNDDSDSDESSSSSSDSDSD